MKLPPFGEDLTRVLALLETWTADEEAAARRSGTACDAYIMEIRRHVKPLRTAWDGLQLRAFQGTKSA